jgi:hypothetical protein
VEKLNIMKVSSRTKKKWDKMKEKQKRIREKGGQNRRACCYSKY